MINFIEKLLQVTHKENWFKESRKGIFSFVWYPLGDTGGQCCQFASFQVVKLRWKGCFKKKNSKQKRMEAQLFQVLFLGWNDIQMDCKIMLTQSTPRIHKEDQIRFQKKKRMHETLVDKRVNQGCFSMRNTSMESFLPFFWFLSLYHIQITTKYSKSETIVLGNLGFLDENETWHWV